MDEIWTSGRVARELGITPARVRQMAMAFNFGRLIDARTRIYTSDEVEQMRARSTGKPGRPPKNKETGSEPKPGAG